MLEPLLQTKLFVPPSRPNLVARPHLIDRLNRGLHSGKKLTLVSAPAGFGKTTLVSEWVQALPGTKPSVPVAWLSLDENDNDLTQFLAYLIAALNQVNKEAALGQGALNMLQSSQLPPMEAVLISLINDLTTLSGRIVLVLDDFHQVTGQLILDTLDFLLEQLPYRLHLVIATRVDPDLHLARLRVRSQLTELRAVDLRFTPAEAAEFLNQVMGLDLSWEDIGALEKRTEGWIAGLQLAAISMRGRQDVTGFVQSFTGSHRFVLDYLLEEVLSQQPATIQDFLLQTSILDRMNGELCDAIFLGGPGKNSTEMSATQGQAILEMLEKRNLFIVCLDDERRWYRYHHLFADLLRQHLNRTYPEQKVILCRRASEWYEQNGFMDEAIDFALKSAEFERAALLVKDQIDVSWTSGEHAKLRRWLDKMPQELVRTKLDLGIIYAWYLFASGKQDEAESFLQAAEHVVENDYDQDSKIKGKKGDRDRRTINKTNQQRGRIAAIRAFMGSYRGDIPGIIRFSQQALEYIPKQDLTWRSLAAISLGNAYGFMGDMRAAYQARLAALEASIAAGNIYFIILANMEVAITLREMGQLHETVEICQQQLQVAREYGISQTAMVGWLFAVWGEVLAELDHLDEADQRTKQALQMTERGGDLLMLGWSYLCRMRVLLSQNDIAGAKALFQKIEDKSVKADVPDWVAMQMAAWRARVLIQEGETDAAVQWAMGRGLYGNEVLNLAPKIGFHQLLEYVVVARILIAKGSFVAAAKFLRGLLVPAEQKEHTTKVIEILILLALAYDGQGATDEARAALGQALLLAEPGGFVRVFTDEGQPMARLLPAALEQGIAVDYVRRLLAAFPDDEPDQAAISQLDQAGLVEPLSERELEVLQHIAGGFTNREIAERLYISLNTVKVHTRNIYSKLGVHSRTQALARAQELGLL